MSSPAVSCASTTSPEPSTQKMPERARSTPPDEPRSTLSPQISVGTGSFAPVAQLTCATRAAKSLPPAPAMFPEPSRSA